MHIFIVLNESCLSNYMIYDVISCPERENNVNTMLLNGFKEHLMVAHIDIWRFLSLKGQDSRCIGCYMDADPQLAEKHDTTKITSMLIKWAQPCT